MSNADSEYKAAEARAMLRLVLMFHKGGAWSPADRRIWKKYTGSDEATSKSLCDAIRKTLGGPEDEQ